MSQVEVKRRGAAALLTISNPPRGFMNQQTALDLNEALDRIGEDQDVRVVVITGGVPGVFVRHYDVEEIAMVTEAARAGQIGVPDPDPLPSFPVHAVLDRIDRLPIPTIAAINGHCMGGGFELAMCCDIRIAEDGDYRIGLPEANVGIFPGAGGAQRLPRLIGEARALEFILRGLVFNPREAAAYDLVNQCVSGSAIEAALALAEELAQKSPLALRWAKRLVKGTLDRPLEQGLRAEREGFVRLLGHRDETALNAMTRFLDEGADILKYL